MGHAMTPSDATPSRSAAPPEAASAAGAIRVAVVEPDPVVAHLYADAVRTRLREARIDRLDFEAPSLAEVLTSAEVCICSAGTDPDPARLFESLIRLLLLRPDLPVILLLPPCAAAQVGRAVELGAADVLLRTAGCLDQLAATVRKTALQARGVGYADARRRLLRESLEGIRAENRALRALIERFEALALTDPLTGLANRRGLDAALARTLASARRHGHSVSCLVIDVDHFKRVNDTRGHAAGDRVLCTLAEVIRAECRESDIPARTGGDEFVVILPHAGPAEAAAVAARLRARFPAQPTLTIGCATSTPDRPLAAADLISAADAAMYTGKRHGRNTIAA